MVMEGGDRVQLGTLLLNLRAPEAQADQEATTSWFALTPEFINSGLFANISTSDDYISLLSELLADPGIEFRAECRVSHPFLIVRCSIIPSDGKGGDWRKKPKKNRSRSLSRLFDGLRAGWDGQVDDRRLLAKREENRLKISELYTFVPSPAPPAPEDWTPISVGDHDAQSRILRGDDIKGISTPLYRYQLRSVNRMIQMEMEPKQLIDPQLTQLSAAGDRGPEKYFVNLANFDIQLYPGRYGLPRGGILCEQMGVGKTLICLAVILSTLHQPAQPPPHEIDISPTVTAHEIHTYPFGPAEEIRFRIPTIRFDAALPSLSEMCANILAPRDHSGASDMGPHLSKLVKQRVCYYRYPPDTDCMRKAKAALISDIPDRVYLSKTTLVIVPLILVEQWLQEIEKHVEPGALSVLRVEGELPGVNKLLEYDIVLMDVDRFGREDTMNRAARDLGPSELLDVRWKRIILDEGHTAGRITSNAMRLAQSLNTERKWAVTGTPTRHLQQGGEQAIGNRPERAAIDPESPIRGWNSEDIEDVARIGVIVGKFLNAEPFYSDVSFQEVITSHLKRREPSFGSVGRLKYLMDSLMVKHRAEEIDNEASLPPTTVETIILPFEPMQRLTFNVLTSLIVANVYACDFVDPDYFLHPKNTNSFQQVVRNLHSACLWFSSSQNDAAGCLPRLQNDIDTKPGLTEDSKRIMLEAADHLRRAISTPGWSEWMRYGVSIPVHIPSLPEEVKDGWSESLGKDIDWVDVYSAMNIRDKNQNGTTMEDLVEAGQKTLEKKRKEADAELDKAVAAATKKQEQLEKKGLTAAQSNAAQNPHTVSPRKKTPTKKDKLAEALAQAARNAQLAIDVEARAHLPRPLAGSVEVKTRSHKMNYVVKSIRSSAPDDKFIIFGTTDELGHCTEVLDFFDISSVYAGEAVPRKARNAALDRFKATDIKVCLLDIKVAARGLHLVVANRMFILAPIWNLDTLAQAIKRIHRIGQTRPTRVEILVTQDTFEEDIAKRASTTRTENEEKQYTRALIEHPRFVYAEFDSNERFKARMIPGNSRENGDRSSPSVQEGRSNTSTPEAALVTPMSRDMAHVSIREESPTPDARVKREVGVEEDVDPQDRKGKKRARVAFA